MTPDDSSNRSELQRSWRRKFGCAIRGIREGVRGQSSFRVHFLITFLVIAAAAGLQATQSQWCLLLLCIALVTSAEMFNTAMEHLARAIAAQDDPRIADALDIGSGAVLVAAIGAAAVGVVIFVERLSHLIH